VLNIASSAAPQIAVARVLSRRQYGLADVECDSVTLCSDMLPTAVKLHRPWRQGKCRIEPPVPKIWQWDRTRSACFRSNLPSKTSTARPMRAYRCTGICPDHHAGNPEHAWPAAASLTPDATSTRFPSSRDVTHILAQKNLDHADAKAPRWCRATTGLRGS
jgi:hypothetical protein